MKIDDTIKKAYGNVPKEPTLWIDFDSPVPRSIKYYWIKFKRFFTR